MVFKFLLRAAFLYSGAFLFSLAVYIYLWESHVPPHTLQLPVYFEMDEEGGGLRAQVALSEEEEAAFVALRSQASLSLTSFMSPSRGGRQLLHAQVPYDIALILRYPDRPEIADLGNLEFEVELRGRRSERVARGDISSRRASSSLDPRSPDSHGSESNPPDSRSPNPRYEVLARAKRLQTLRYESPILRGAREVFQLPWALWQGIGSERIETINLFERWLSEEHGGWKKKNKSQNSNLFSKAAILSSAGSTGSNDAALLKSVDLRLRPARFPFHSASLQITARFSGLHYFLFHWRWTAAFLIIGALTALLWGLISMFLVSEAIARVYVVYCKRSEAKNEEPNEETSQERNDERDEERNQEASREAILSVVADDESIEIVLPDSQAVATFLGELRQRRIQLSRHHNAIKEEDETVETSQSSEGLGDSDILDVLDTEMKDMGDDYESVSSCNDVSERKVPSVNDFSLKPLNSTTEDDQSVPETLTLNKED